MLKYDFKELDKPVVIDEPAVQDIIIADGGKHIAITVTTAAGQDETTLDIEEGEDARFTVHVGDIDSIKFGGTDNWGYYKLILPIGNEEGATEYDSILVNNITVDPVGGENGWCHCEQVSAGALKYTAISKNNSTQPRYAIFKHKTTDKVISGGEAAGRPAAPEWYVTVMQPGTEDIQPEPTPTPPEPEPTPEDLGNYLYSVGLISDTHVCEEHNDWWDEADFTRAMNLLSADSNVKFIASCGDLIQADSQLQTIPEKDAKDFEDLYKQSYWEQQGLRFFTPLGNHDFYGIFESRNGDNQRQGYKNSECVSGYNSSIISVNSEPGRMSLWPTGAGINAEFSGARIQFDPVTDTHKYNGQGQLYGQGDINFFEYNSYIGMYKNAAGYTGNVTDASDDYKITSAAKQTLNFYLTNNWNSCKNNLSGWNQPRDTGYRNNYSKLNYWLKKDNDIFVFMSVDYGNDTWNTNTHWHDRMIHARNIIDTTSGDPYIRRMVEYVSDTGYSNEDKPYNYQYYDPNVLIWLKEIIENNPNKKIYVFSHHFLPHKAGNSTGIPKDGGYYYSYMHANGVYDNRDIVDINEGNTYNKGSNALSGIEFWFLNKLNNQYKNVIFFNGHSHFSWDAENVHFVNNDYNIITPTEAEQYYALGTLEYTRKNNTSKQESGYTVSLPSLSKPRGGNGSSKYDDAEMSIMEIYENGVKIKGYKIKENNQDADTLIVEKSIKLID